MAKGKTSEAVAKEGSADTPVRPAALPPVKVVIAGPTEMESALLPLLAQGWKLHSVAQCNHSNEHAAYLIS